jgi:hypothetical protein
MTRARTTTTVDYYAELVRAEAELDRAEQRFAEARRERDELVRAALADGYTQAGVAEALELTRQRVAQILRGTR